MDRFNKVLILVLITIIFTDLFLFVRMYKVTNFDSFIKFKNQLPFIKKEFIIKDEEFLQLNRDNIIYQKGDSKVPYFGRASFIAYIINSPYFNKQLNVYVLPIKLQLKNKNLLANLILGSENRLISLKISNNGIVKDSDPWTLINVKNSLIYFNTKMPLIVSMFFDDEIYDILKNKNDCKEKCRNNLNLYKQYSKNAKDIFNNTSSKQLEIGPVEFLVIYGKK